jgi:hypothetical protein
MNGNPKDGPYGNGHGTWQAELWLDTGNVGFRWQGPDGRRKTIDDVRFYPLKRTGNTAWREHDITGSISSDGKTFEVTLPLSLLGNPKTIELGVMSSPWTTSSSDNTDRDAATKQPWLVISDTSKSATYRRSDAVGDNRWPSLRPERKRNFDLTSTEVVISHEGVGVQNLVHIHVYDNLGMPMKDAHVTLAGKTAESLGGGKYQVLNLQPSSDLLKVSAPGFTSVSKGVEIKPHFTALDVELSGETQETCRLTGHVINSVNRQPVPAAIVEVAGRTAHTDRSGRYAFFGLTPVSETMNASAMVKVSAAGYGSRTTSTELRSNVNTLNVALSPLTATSAGVTGYVYDAKGSPIGGAVVSAAGTIAVTEGDGYFAISAAAPMTTMMQVSATGYRPEKRAVGVDETFPSVTFNLKTKRLDYKIAPKVQVFKVSSLKLDHGDRFKVVVENNTDYFYLFEVISDDSPRPMKILGKKEKWEYTVDTSGSIYDGSEVYEHHVSIRAQLSLPMYWLQSAYVVLFQEPPPTSCIEDILLLVAKTSEVPVDNAYDIDASKAINILLEILKDEKLAKELSDVLAKHGIKKSAKEITDKVTAITDLKSMAEASLWQIKILTMPDTEASLVYIRFK